MHDCIYLFKPCFDPVQDMMTLINTSVGSTYWIARTAESIICYRFRPSPNPHSSHHDIDVGEILYARQLLQTPFCFCNCNSGNIILFCNLFLFFVLLLHLIFLYIIKITCIYEAGVLRLLPPSAPKLRQKFISRVFRH